MRTFFPIILASVVLGGMVGFGFGHDASRDQWQDTSVVLGCGEFVPAKDDPRKNEFRFKVRKD